MSKYLDDPIVCYEGEIWPEGSIGGDEEKDPPVKGEDQAQSLGGRKKSQKSISKRSSSSHCVLASVMVLVSWHVFYLLLMLLLL